jgi:exodeoxyribonuclease VII small subunit
MSKRPASATAPAAAEAAPEEDLRFEALVRELETLVGRLESDELALDEALDLYARGVRLAVKGDTLLQGAERRIVELKQTLAEGPESAR